MAFINIQDPIFEDVEQKASAIVEEYCLKTEQYLPKSRAEILRILFESLVLEIKAIFLDQSEDYVGDQAILYTMGLYDINELLCQWIADAIQIEVKTVPTEVTVSEKTFTPNTGRCWETYEKMFRLLKLSVVSRNTNILK